MGTTARRLASYKCARELDPNLREAKMRHEALAGRLQARSEPDFGKAFAPRPEQQPSMKRLGRRAAQPAQPVVAPPSMPRRQRVEPVPAGRKRPKKGCLSSLAYFIQSVVVAAFIAPIVGGIGFVAGSALSSGDESVGMVAGVIGAFATVVMVFGMSERGQ